MSETSNEVVLLERICELFEPETVRLKAPTVGQHHASASCHSLSPHSATGREVFDWILDQGYYSERDTSNVVRQVLEAVAYLHSLNIVHRNLKVLSPGPFDGQEEDYNIL